MYLFKIIYKPGVTFGNDVCFIRTSADSFTSILQPKIFNLNNNLDNFSLYYTENRGADGIVLQFYQLKVKLINAWSVLTT